MLGPGDEAFRRGERSASFWEGNGDRSPLSVEPENRRENIFVRMIYIYTHTHIYVHVHTHDLNVLRGRNSLLTSYQPHPLNIVLSFSLKLSSAWFLAMTDRHYEVFS